MYTWFPSVLKNMIFVRLVDKSFMVPRCEIVEFRQHPCVSIFYTPSVFAVTSFKLVATRLVLKAPLFFEVSK